MHKLVLLVVTLVVVVSFVGCQQSGLSEEEVRSIVAEEVARQLASEQVRDNVGEEVTAQLSSLDYVVGAEVTRQLADVSNIVRQEVTRQLSTLDTLTVSELYVKNKDGKNAVMIGASVQEAASIIIINSYDECIAYLGTDSYGNGSLILFDKYGRVTFIAP